jgi:hypothetical protein
MKITYNQNKGKKITLSIAAIYFTAPEKILKIKELSGKAGVAAYDGNYECKRYANILSFRATA